jgi:uncharacterized membrane protein
MIRLFATYLGTAMVMVTIDLLWIGVIAKPLYQQGIGHLMADQPRLWAVAVFYLIYPVGLMFFAILPNEHVDKWQSTAAAAAMFGFLAYATYDLTNLATLRDWPIGLSLIDTAWGTLVSTAAAITGRAILTSLTPS